MAKSQKLEQCTYIKSDGEQCKSNGLPNYNGLCFVHHRMKKEEEGIVLLCVETYMNGSIGIPGTAVGERITVTKPKYEQIMRDNPDAFEVVG